MDIGKSLKKKVYSALSPMAGTSVIRNPLQSVRNQTTMRVWLEVKNFFRLDISLIGWF